MKTNEIGGCAIEEFEKQNEKEKGDEKENRRKEEKVRKQERNLRNRFPSRIRPSNSYSPASVIRILYRILYLNL